MPKVNKKLLERRIRLTNDFTALEKRYLLTTIGVDDNGDVMPFLNPSNEDFGMMLCSAVRYALGRMSYITGATADYVEKFIPYLPESALQNINQDITYAQLNKNLGMACDRVIWIGLRDAIQAELQRRKDERNVE